MPRKKWIDKHKAQTFQLLHRPQTDPAIWDETQQDRILYQTSGPSASSRVPQGKSLHIADLEEEVDLENVRENEGEAANYGIYFDDSQYDYMQHLRDAGEGSGEAHFVDAASVKVTGKGKSKMVQLQDALRGIDLSSDAGSRAGASVDDSLSEVPSLEVKRTYQDQQDVPDEIAGFQPDMDPRLREALEALDDEAYVDAKDEEDMFGELVKDGAFGEMDLDEFEASFGEDDEGWESDRTERPPTCQISDLAPEPPPSFPVDGPRHFDQISESDAAAAAVSADGEWLEEFAKFKRASKNHRPLKAQDSPSIAASSNIKAPSSLYTLGGTPLRKKKRKGALTNPSSYSMTSSSLVRTEGQELLDARFDKVVDGYEEEEDEEDEEDGGMSIVSGLSKQSRTSILSTKSFQDGPGRQDLDSMMDGFLDGWNKGNPGGSKRMGPRGKRGKNGNEVAGMAMLDEIRQGLGPARFKA
ncbi:MAG: hypothetical protein Q9227_006355 [Pyrenula ochraceoflavens]